MSLQFFEVDSAYLSYLRSVEPRIPNTDYPRCEKFFCGVVLHINGFEYLAPVSRFTKAQQSSFLIYDPKGMPISSVRCAFMFPCAPELRKRKDFCAEPDHAYRHLLWLEYQYCLQHEKELHQKARHVYHGVCEIEHCYIAENCCDFAALERRCAAYKKEQQKTADVSPAAHLTLG